MKKKCYRDLSGGQQQRVLIARALCASEKILLLDEPVTGLDPVTTANLYQIIEELNKEYGMSIIMVTHDMNSDNTLPTTIARTIKLYENISCQRSNYALRNRAIIWER